MLCGMKLTVSNRTLYPVPLHQRHGAGVSWFTYAHQVDAMRASVLAEQMATVRWAQGQDFLYALPGQIVRNQDGTYTVVVV